MRGDGGGSMSRGLFSHCPLKKRPVLFCQDSEEPRDVASDKNALEPENLSTKPEDLRVVGRTQTPSSAVTPIILKRCSIEDRSVSPTPFKGLYQNVNHSYQYSQHHDQILSESVKSQESSSESFNSNRTIDPYRTTFPSAWQHIAPHCLPYLYPYPYAEEVYSKYYSTGAPLDQPITYPTREDSPNHIGHTHVSSLSKRYESHRTTDVCCLSPTSTTSSFSQYHFLETPTPPRTPEELLSPRSVSSSEGSSTGSTGYGKRVIESTSTHRYQCSFCSKSYSTYSGLSKHQQFHCAVNKDSSTKKTFSCKSCDKVYVSLGALKMHIRTHTLPCKCVICGKAFSRPWLLQGHIRTHTGEKPFSCPLCERAFADRSNLRAHLQTHSEVKKYSCSVCGKSFSRMSLLTKHLGGGCPGPCQSSEDISTQ